MGKKIIGLKHIGEYIGDPVHKQKYERELYDEQEVRTSCKTPLQSIEKLKKKLGREKGSSVHFMQERIKSYMCERKGIKKAFQAKGTIERKTIEDTMKKGKLDKSYYKWFYNNVDVIENNKKKKNKKDR